MTTNVVLNILEKEKKFKKILTSQLCKSLFKVNTLTILSMSCLFYDTKMNDINILLFPGSWYWTEILQEKRTGEKR